MSANPLNPAPLPHRRAAWILMVERIREAAAYARRLKGADEPLCTIAAAFDRLAARLAEHIEDRR